jgi:endonuclease-3
MAKIKKPKESFDDKKRRAAAVLRRLGKAYPDARCALDHRSPLELLVATILSAQCTDARVNMVTPHLFATYKTAADYARSPKGVLENEIRSTGFFNAKAKSIRSACAAIAAEHGGRVPDQMEKLLPLPGVGRKTANVVLGNAFGKAEGVVVDTHMKRLAYRMGLTDETDPVDVERDLMACVPKKDWIYFSHAMIWHGRRVCKAARPACDVCALRPHCPQRGLDAD